MANETPNTTNEEVASNKKTEWQAPTLNTISAQQTQGKDFTNADEATASSGPS